jgi:P-type conjugative transfer protein TrbJ
MKHRFLGSATVAVAFAISFFLIGIRPAHAQLAVVDVKNLEETTLQAARALRQINIQIQALQNQVTMIGNQARNLTSLNYSSLTGITSDLTQIGKLMNQAEGISFDVQSVATLFTRYYPRSYGNNAAIPQLLSDAQTRWQNARQAFQQTMLAQAQIARTVQSDTAKLAGLVKASQGAVGGLQAQQATNQLLALSIKQQLQVQSLLAAQGRAQALKDANEAEAEEEGRAALSTFLGSSNAYGGQ